MATDQQEAVAALLARSGRDFLPLRRSFLQLRTPGGGAAPLAAFVAGRRRRALDLYLLAHALASREPWDVALPSVVWARLLGLQRSAAASIISRQWSWLEDQELVASRRRARLREVTLLREDGSGAAYTHPGQPGEGDYFRVPYVYWEGHFPDRLDLPAKAVLLIALSLQDDFVLPLEHGSRWYGVSADVLRSGLRTLRTLRLLDVRVVRKPAPLTARGVTEERRYTLRGPLRPQAGAVDQDDPTPPATTRGPLQGRRHPRGDPRNVRRR